MSSRPWRIAASLVAAVALAFSTIPAFADGVEDDVSGSGAVALALTGASVSTTIRYEIKATGTGGGLSGCDASATNTVVFDVVIGAGTANVSSDVATLSFNACGVSQPVEYTATSAGTRPVELRHKSGAGSFDIDKTKATLTITGAPANTPPTVAVTGVTDATGYPFGAVPAAGCSVTDAEDVGESATPSLSPITGPNAVYGLGTQTATCSYTDGGGLTRSATATYTIVDTVKPTLNTPGDISGVEATGPGGATASWAVTASDNVALAGSPTCTPASGSTFPLGASTVTCSVSDVAGNTQTGSFTVTVSDTGDPSITAPADITAEATSSAGAVVTFDDPVVSDTVDTELTPVCVPASGSTFPLGETEVTCSVTDDSANSSSASFTVTVRDTTPPVVAPHDNETAEATSPDGAVVDFVAPTASDAVSGSPDVTCEPASGNTFPLGLTTVTCSATDAAGNTGSTTFTVLVEDTTPPVLDAHGDETVEATGPDGASVDYTAPGATDLVDTDVDVVCSPASGTQVAVGGSTEVTCTATDDAGNAAYSTFFLYVVDTIPPVIDPHGDEIVEATGPGGASVSYTAPNATDIVDGTFAATCTPASPVTVTVDGTTPVSCTATDAAGNSSSSTFNLKVVDTTAPALTVPANISTTATSASGATVIYSASASDLVDGPVTPVCTPESGSTFAPGTTTVSCTATDAHGNTSAAQTFTVTVSFSFNGFFAPVDNNGVLNTIKGGQSVPLKWAIPNGSGGFISSLGVVSGVKQASFTCTAGAPTDDIEAPTSGATSLRYDTTANQYIYNWQSPKGANACYKVTVYLTDGTSKSALFKTK